MAVVYREDKNIAVEDVRQLYNEVGWTAYTQNQEVLEKIIPNAFAVISAWDGEQLVGLVRVLSDGVYILYVQDLLFKPTYQNQGIGSQLLTRILKRYANMRQTVLLTEYAQDKMQFYAKFGFAPANQANVGIGMVKVM
jgi:GNAT superfamily N-acetyltransferase